MTATQCLAWQTLIGTEFYTAHRHIVGVIYDMTHMQPILYGTENKKNFSSWFGHSASYAVVLSK